jgi:cation:H+ antiporter
VLVLIAMSGAGLVLLAVAADQLVAGASRIASWLRMPPVVVGVVVIGLGTSAPEFLLAGLAATRGEVALALASLVGSNIVNVTLILGVAALIAPIAVSSSTVRREAPMSVGAVLIFAVAVVLGLGTVAGAVLGLVAVAAMKTLVWLARRAHEPPVPSVVSLAARRIRPAAEAGRTLLGLAGTLTGAQLLVVNASALAVELGISAEVVGFTLVAIGTSLPELVTAVQAQRRREPDLLVGNLLGSNLFNSLAGGAVVALSAGPDPEVHLAIALLGIMVAIGALAWLLLWKGYRASRKDGVLLLLVYAACLPLLL